MAKCKILAKKIDGHVGWIVERPDGAILRKFVDTNDDNVVDQWSYYKDGLEVYRDIDSNFNGKADQYRWFHTGGSRWGVDANEDGVIDSWKSISAEEVTAEVVAAIATHDAERFARLVLTPAELKSLGLGKIASRERGREDRQGRRPTSRRCRPGRRRSRATPTWVQFSANRPGVVPAGTDDSTKDLRVYENVVAIVESGGKHGQVQIGTLVQVGDAVAGDRPAAARGRRAGRRRAVRVLLPGRDDASQRAGQRRDRAKPRRSCWPIWKASTARPPRRPRPRSRPDSIGTPGRPAGADCRRRQERRRARHVAAAAWPT